MKVLVLFYSLYGHVKAMAEAAVKGASAVKGTTVELKRFPETLPDSVLEKMGALQIQQSFANIPVVEPDDLEAADAVIFCSPTRYGNMCGQVSQFIDSTVGLWLKGALVGKVGGAISSSATQHGGNETTLLSLHKFMFHQGMVVAGLPYAFQDQMGVEEIKGGSPYGATTIAGAQGERQPGEKDLAGAEYQGKYIAQLAQKLRA